MPQPVDVGMLLGGRYKVTAQVLASAEHDLVLDGVDQVLNRPVSILVSAPENASQVAMSAREIATGERASNVQILDLGNADGVTYLVTNEAQAADLLDLVIQRDGPYVEPFFTDTLGSEIFGQVRSTEPEPYEDEYEEYEDEPRQSLRDRLNKLDLPKLGKNAPEGTAKARFGRQPEGSASGAGAAAGAAAAAASAGAHVPPPPSAPPAPASASPATAPVSRQVPASRPAAAQPAAEKPRVSLWPEDDGDEAEARSAAVFPAAARTSNQPEADDYEYDEYDDEERNSPRSSKLLVGGLLAVLLVVAIVVAVSQLNLFRGGPVANGSEAGNETGAASSPAETGAEEESAPAAEVVEPVIADLTRQVPDMQELDAENDGKLSEAVDGNPATYWASFQYVSDNFGGYAKNMALVVELEDPSSISSVVLTQLSGTGGNFSVLLNDEPTLDGANQVAQGSFTAQKTTIPVPEQDGAAPKAQYVLINFTQLPKLSNPMGGPPYGIRMAEIEVS
ncbi:ABC transporter substrate-binding protein [Arthrobacter sp. NPDC089319]|uniref:ABC transporter substrate-binding protein n=1 Tax=Arthrobacter sp. NPDC089319 TaxID=3155915 RepID=UPI0034147D08